MTVFMTGRTGKTEVAAFLCIITKGMNGLKIEKKIYRVVISRYPRFLRYSGLARRMLEKDIVAAILRHLKQRPRCFAWKTHGGMYGTAGIPDIIACIDGRFYAFEVKQPTGKLTRLQEVTLDKIRVAGGVAVMVTSVKEVKSALDGPALSAGAAGYWRETCRLNEQINEKLVEAARLRKAGRLAEYAALESEIDREIDALVDLKDRHGRPGKEALYDCMEISE